jgi:hypothetical protein
MTFVRFWTDERIAELITLRDQRMSQKAAAAHFGVKGPSVQQACAKYNILWTKAGDIVWTEAMVTQLESLVADKQSARSISRTLGVSRSAVCGKCNRLGLKLISEQVGGWPKGTPRVKGIKRVPRPKAAPPAPVVVDPVPFLQITAGRCHWPIAGEGADMVCCGSTAPVYPYCEGHKVIGTRPAHTTVNTASKLARSLRRFA